MGQVSGRDGKPVARGGDDDGACPAGPDAEGGEGGASEGRDRSVDTRFKKGNKHGKGRPKGIKNLKTIANEASNAKVSAKINGETKKVTKIALAMHQLANKAAAGDLRAIDKLIALQERYGPQEDPAGPSAEEARLDLDSLQDFLSLRTQLDDPSGEPGHV